MEQDQYRRVIAAIEYTLEQLRRGPKGKEGDETVSKYGARIEGWYTRKHKFCLYAIRCLKLWDRPRADLYLDDLRQLGDEI